MTNPAPQTTPKTSPPPPKRTAPIPARDKVKPPGEPPAPTPLVKPGKYVEFLEDVHNVLGVAIMPFAPLTSMKMFEEVTLPGDDDDEDETHSRNHHAAVQIDKIAQTNAGLRRTLERLTKAGPMAVLGTVYAPVLASAAGELGLFAQLGKLFSRKNKPEPVPDNVTPMNGVPYTNPEFHH